MSLWHFRQPGMLEAAELWMTNLIGKVYYNINLFHDGTCLMNKHI